MAMNYSYEGVEFFFFSVANNYSILCRWPLLRARLKPFSESLWSAVVNSWASSHLLWEKKLNNHTLQNFVAKMVLCMKCFVILPFICCFKSIRVVGIFKLLHAKIYTCYIRLLSTFFLMGFLLLLGVFDSLHFPPFALTNALPVYIYAFSYAMQHKMQACRCISVYHSSHCKYILL